MGAQARCLAEGAAYSGVGIVGLIVFHYYGMVFFDPVAAVRNPPRQVRYYTTGQVVRAAR